jgi:hypothetical protein
LQAVGNVVAEVGGEPGLVVEFEEGHEPISLEHSLLSS